MLDINELYDKGRKCQLNLELTYHFYLQLSR